ncbi:MAG: pyrophosphatase [Proteobacteria bacterium]|nr:pyrophosphatase [Pseudomonadota bacterium]
MAQGSFVPGHRGPARIEGRVSCCVFHGNRVFITRDGGLPVIPQFDSADCSFDLDAAHYLGLLGGTHCYGLALQREATLPAGLELLGLRALILEGNETVAAVAGQAWQVLEWARTHRHCGCCGAPTVPHAADRAVECPDCKLVFYPRIAPVIMGLVYRRNELLLTRKPGYAPGRYTVVAGFVEAGESLEQCLAREVAEEVGVTIRNPSYFGSQPWPFPNSLVMAFSAEWVDGEVRPDQTELEEARWFAIDALPDLPEAVHISRQLIDDTLARMRGAA